MSARMRCVAEMYVPRRRFMRCFQIAAIQSLRVRSISNAISPSRQDKKIDPVGTKSFSHTAVLGKWRWCESLLACETFGTCTRFRGVRPQANTNTDDKVQT